MESTVKYTPFFLLGCVLIVSLLVGLLTRRHDKGGYGIQVHSISHAKIGAAIASNWMSAASFLGIAGVFFLTATSLLPTFLAGLVAMYSCWF